MGVMLRSAVWLFMSLYLFLSWGCGEQSSQEGRDSAPAADQHSSEPKDLPKGLLLALSQFEVDGSGKVIPKPGPARLEFLFRKDGAWHSEALEDPESNVFHKAMVYAPNNGKTGILTLGGNAAAVKLWRKEASGFVAETLWQKDFGGKHSRMRDVERADLFGEARSDLAVATHDQGVVAVIRPRGDGFEVNELGSEKDTFVHEIEVGDLDGDGALEVYATPSEPNRLDGSIQTR